MADIILPQVDLLTSTNDDTNVLVEQGGQINRVNKSLFGSSDAKTLNGHAASYFAPAASLSTTNTNVSNLTTRISTLESAKVTRTLLWEAPADQADYGIGAGELTLNDSLNNYDALEFVGIWTYMNQDQGWGYSPNQTFIINRSESSDNGGIKYAITTLGYVRIFLMTSDHNYSIFLYQGIDTSNGQGNDAYCVPSAIYGIKYN